MIHQSLITKHTIYSSNKENIILIHGFLCSTQLWSSLTQQLQSRYNIYFVNLPGHNGNKGTIKSINELAQLILEALTALNLDSVHIIGHSLGGYIAGEMAQINQSIVKSITLINSSLLEDSQQKKNDRNKAIRAVKITPSVFSRNVIEKLFSEKSRQEHQSIIDQTQQAAAGIKDTTIIDYLEAMRDRESTLKSSAQIPKLFISSREDTTVPFSRVQPQFETPNTTSIVLEKSNHMGFIEESDLVYQAIESFFVSFSS